jgi:ribonuclease R
VLQYLTGEVQNATSVIMIAASQEEQWESLSYVEWQNGPSFAAWLEITIAGVMQTTAEPGISFKKQVARHHAGLGWLNGYLQGTLVSPEQRLEPQFSSVTPERTSSSILGSSLKLGENAISQLNHWCQHMGWPVPVYEFSKTETGFRCDCQCYCLEEWRVRSGVATSKRGAKQQAAELVLEHILDILAG